jgi:predicted cupin superfamily sugar epimerase
MPRDDGANRAVVAVAFALGAASGAVAIHAARRWIGDGWIADADSSDTSASRKDALIAKLGMVPHPEGGFFVETYRTGTTPMRTRGKTSTVEETRDAADALAPTSRRASDDDDGARNCMTSIYYMLTRESAFQYWACNESDHVHYHHAGASVTYHLTRPDGTYERKVLGQRVERGEVLQLVVRGGTFKAAVLESGGEFALIGEGVAPGFDFRDFAFVTDAQLASRNPAAYDETRQWIKPVPEDTFDHYYSKSSTGGGDKTDDGEDYFTPTRSDDV